MVLPRSDAGSQPPMEDLRLLSKRLDRSSAQELLAICAVAAVMLSALVAGITLDVRGEQVSSGTTWAIAASVGILAGLIAGIVQVIAWRRAGGRPVQRYARRVWRERLLPRDPRLRIAVLRDLERRARVLDHHYPMRFAAGSWTVVAILQITAEPRPWTIVAWTPLVACSVGAAVVQQRDREEEPHLRALIGELRDDPLGIG